MEGTEIINEIRDAIKDLRCSGLVDERMLEERITEIEREHLGDLHFERPYP